MWRRSEDGWMRGDVVEGRRAGYRTSELDGIGKVTGGPKVCLKGKRRILWDCTISDGIGEMVGCKI